MGKSLFSPLNMLLEMLIKDGHYVTKVCQSWFISCDKGIILMQDLWIGKFGVVYTRTLCTIPAIFL